MIYNVIARSTLAAESFNLSARRYKTLPEKHQSDVLLGSLFESIEQDNTSRLPYQSRLITIRHLKSDDLNFTLYGDTLPIERISTARLVYKLEEDALLVALRTTELKPTWYVHHDTTNAYIVSEIVSLRLISSEVSIAYLVSELNSDYVLKQVKMYQTGSTVPTLTRRDLLRLRIRLPRLNEQNARVEGAKEALIKLKENEIEQLRSTKAHKQEAYESLATLKHALGTPLRNLGSAVNLLQAFIQQQATQGLSVTSDTPLFKDRTDATVQSTLNSMRQKLEFVHNLLARSDDELEFDAYPLEPINIIDYLKKLVEDTIVSYPLLKINFRPSIELEEFYKGKISANKDLLDRLFFSLFDNCERHAFPEIHKDDEPEVLKEIEIVVGYTSAGVRPSLFVLVNNNGVPLPENFTKAQFIRKKHSVGGTGNKGIGGSDIDQIVKRFGGAFELSSNPRLPFPVSFSFDFPLIGADAPESTDEDL